MIIELKRLTDKQRRAYFMRYQYGWRMKQIAVAMGIEPHSVSRLLQRAMARAGLPARRYFRVRAGRPRRVGVLRLGSVYGV